jgi:predicted naringenin-chalcone synthase
VVTRPVIVGSGQAFPGSLEQQQVWDGFFAEHFAGNRLARRIFESSGVLRRHGVANPLVEDLSRWSTEARMRRYVTEAQPLGKDALASALDDAGVPSADIGLFAVVSCTGYATPGLDITLACDTGMPNDVQRLVIGHMGCYAALPGLGAVRDFVVARRRPAALLCLELTSLHVQPPTTDMQQVVAHALFSDAAAALVLVPADDDGARDDGGAPGLEVVDVAAVTDSTTADHMTWDVTDLGFRMGLSPRVPDVLALHVAATIHRLLDRNGVAFADVDGWAVHPGGPRILDVVAHHLGLPEDAVDASRAVLAEHGNCSSATVLLVVEEMRRRGVPRPGGHLVAMAFGPGLTLYAALLRRGR